MGRSERVTVYGRAGWSSEERSDGCCLKSTSLVAHAKIY